MITRRVDTERESYTEQATDALRELVAQGANNACERVLQRYPELKSNADDVLELICLESILRQDRDPTLTVSSLTDDYTRRFPHFEQDIVKLLEVNRAFASLGLNLSSDSNGHLSGDDKPAMLPDSIGNIGEYQLLEVLGQGGMGVVYRAIQARLGRVVAIKTIAATHVDRATVSRFQKEAELASSLQHPNIVQIHEVGVHDEIPFYSMEFIAGGSLAEFLKENPLRPDRAAMLVAVLARAIDFAHSRGIVHRDLKPANILLSPSKRPEALKFYDSRSSFEGKATEEGDDRFEPKIVDFGLAIQLAAPGVTPTSGRAAGTPSYMAPEQIDASLGSTSAATDVYALGSILYHSLVGRPPFYAATTQETLRQVRDDEPISPRKLQPKISSDLETICLKCLHKTPGARYTSAADLADDLQRYLDGKPIQARSASLPELAYKWSKRHPSLVGLMAAMLLTIVSTTWLWRQSVASLAAELSERHKSEQLNYDRNIALAHLEFESHDVDRALEILNQCDPKFRNFEWQLVYNMCKEPEWESKSETSHRLADAALSSDGRLVATGHGYWGDDIDQTVYVWDVPNNKLLWRLRGHPESEVAAVDFHPNTKRLLTGATVWRGRNTPGELREWDLETGELIRVVSNQNVRRAQYSKDGTRIYVGEVTGRVCIYDADSAKLLSYFTRHKQLVLSMCESRDGKFLATTGRDGTIAIIDVEQGKEVTWLKDMGDPREINWSMDMSTILVSGFGGRVHTLRWHNNSLELVSSTSQASTQLCRYSPDGRLLVTGVSGEGVKLLDADDRHVMRVLHGHRAQIRSLDFDKTGKLLLTAGTDGSLRVWNLTRQYGFTHMARLPVGEAQSIANRPGTSQFAISLGVQMTRPKDHSGGNVVLYDASMQRSLRTFRLKPCADGSRNYPNNVGFSPSGKYLVAGSVDNSVFVWDATKVEPIATLTGHESPPLFVGMPNDECVVSVDQLGNVKEWNLADQRETSSWSILSSLESNSERSKPTVRALAADFKKRWLAVGTDSQVCLLDLDSHQLLRSIELNLAVNQLAFSPDSQRLAVATASPKTLVYNIEERNRVVDLPSPLQLIGNREQVTALSFSPDSRRLASLGRDEALRLYELELGNEILKLERGSLANGVVAFSGDGNQLLRATIQQVHTYSLKRIDPTENLNEQQRLVRWHKDNFSSAFDNLQTYAATFHGRELIAMEPKVERHKLNMALALLDGGELDEAEQWLRSINSKNVALNFDMLCCMVRIALLKRDIQTYQELMLDLECLAYDLDKPDYWNNLVWYGSLLPKPVINLKEALRRFELATAKSTEGTHYNTRALAYYRTRNYAKAIPTALESMLTTNKPTPHPIDYLIQSLCQIPILAMSLPGSVDKIRDEEAKAKAFRVRAQALQVLLGHIQKSQKESEQRRLVRDKLSITESELMQLEVPLLLEELHRGMQRCKLSHPIFEQNNSQSLVQ